VNAVTKIGKNGEEMYLDFNSKGLEFAQQSNPAGLEKEFGA